MALFKILKGNSSKLPEKRNEGYCYFTEDEHKFYIDVDNSTRVPLNAEDATTLAGKSVVDEITDDNKNNIPDGKAVIDYINNNHYIVHLSNTERYQAQQFYQYNFANGQIASNLINNNYHVKVSVDEGKYINDKETMFKLKKYISQNYRTCQALSSQTFSLLFNTRSNLLPEIIHLIFECYSD